MKCIVSVSVWISDMFLGTVSVRGDPSAGTEESYSAEYWLINWSFSQKLYTVTVYTASSPTLFHTGSQFYIWHIFVSLVSEHRWNPQSMTERQVGFTQSRTSCFLVLDLLICNHCREELLRCHCVLDATLFQTALWRPGRTWTVGGLCEWHGNSENMSVSWCFSRSGGINDCNSERLSLWICLHLRNSYSFLRGWEAGCVCVVLSNRHYAWKLGDSIMVLIWHLNDEMVRFCVLFSQHHPLSTDLLYIFLAQTQQRNKFSLSLFHQRNKCHSKQSRFFCPSQRRISSDWEHCPAPWLIMYL